MTSWSPPAADIAAFIPDSLGHIQVSSAKQDEGCLNTCSVAVDLIIEVTIYCLVVVGYHTSRGHTQ